MRKLVISFVGILAMGALVVGCGDDDKPKDTGPGKKDTIKFDGGVDDTGGGDQMWLNEGSVSDGGGKCEANILGTPCTQSGGECGGSPYTCLLTSSTGGVCTCQCTPDDSQTPLVNEDTCPGLANHSCGKVSLSDGSSKNFCFAHCNPTIGKNTCKGKLSCLPQSGAYAGLFDKAVCFFSGCAANSECPVITTTACSVKAKNCPSGQECVAIVSGGDDGLCAIAGKCDTVSGLCDVKPASLSKATAKVGDACKDDRDCAGNMRCSMEIDQAKYKKKENATCTSGSDCCSGTCTGGKCTKGICAVENRNGYCVTRYCAFSTTLTQFACDSGSDCSLMWAGGLCFKTCDMTSKTDCRNNTADYFGDYECRGWNNLTLGGIPVTKKPICEPGHMMECDMLSASKLYCDSVGADKNNKTNMKCRDLANKATTNKDDPTGRCYDDTSSGTKIRSPLPTP